jgi:hypothetical protein
MSVFLPIEFKNKERADRNQNSDHNEVDNNLLREELPDANRLLCSLRATATAGGEGAAPR